MASAKPTIVIVHGAWHEPASYSKLEAALQSAGYEVVIPHLTSTDSARPAGSGLVTDTAQLRACVEGLVDAGKTVIVILHSYGGHVGSNALYGLSADARAEKGTGGGVARLIYMCAFLLPEGWTTGNQVEAHAAAPENEPAPHMDLAFDNEGYCTIANGRELFLNSLDDEAEATAYMSTVRPWSVKSMLETLTHCAWREIPSTYVHTTEDLAIPLSSQQMMVDRALADGWRDPVVVTLRTDHSPHVTATEDMVDIVNKAAATV